MMSAPPHDLDRILGNEPPIQPSRGFAARVMTAVHAEASRPGDGAARWEALWPPLAAAATALPVVGATEALDAAVTIEGLGLSFTHFVGLVLIVTLGIPMWCTGVLRPR